MKCPKYTSDNVQSLKVAVDDDIALPEAADDDVVLPESRLAAEDARRTARGARRPRLAECPDCGAMVSVLAQTCPKCGCPFKDERRPRRVKDSGRCPECGSRKWDWQTRATQGGIALCVVMAVFLATLPLCWIPLIAMRERFRVCGSCREEL
jgi:hypothetical protein